MTVLDPRHYVTPFAATFSDAAPVDANISLDRNGSEASIVLRGEFDERAADQLTELVDWLVVQGPVHVVATVSDEPAASDGFAFRRLAALARVRGRIEAHGGTLQVRATRRLDRTLAAMRLAAAPT